MMSGVNRTAEMITTDVLSKKLYSCKGVWKTRSPKDYFRRLQIR